VLARRTLVRQSLKPIDRFLRAIPGVIHIGANTGEEREFYRQLGLQVLWIEAIAEVYERLRANIATIPHQRAINALLADVDGEELDFHIASNGGHSSSIFEFAAHARVWPDIRYVSHRRMVARTLDRLVEEHDVDLANYSAIVLDVQCAELRVLAGATQTLQAISWIRLPAADYESYRGAPGIEEVGAFLNRQGFTRVGRQETTAVPGYGTTAEFLFARNV
jgi:FkbM family methyltransferase